ncbi:MAG TPA: hypothetical protein VM143_13810 [Acidimicrobiales bacterium]|nr:hypothetical protein [Acidimicrobiales bacterium]
MSRVLDRLDLGLGVEVLRRDWTTREGFDPGKDAWVARDGGEVVGFAACYPGAFGEAAALDASLYPSLLDLVETRAIDRGDHTVSFLAEAESPLWGTLAGRSYAEEDSYFNLRLDLTGPRGPVPAGIDVRPAEGHEDERLVFELVTSCYADEPDFDRWRAWITMWTFDPELWLLGAVG